LSKVAIKLGKHEQLMRRWSAKHDWVARAAAWDVEVDRAGREGLLKGYYERMRRQTRGYA